MGYLSICLCLLHFFLSKSCNFHCTDLSLSLVKFIPEYFTVFDALMKGIVFKISFSSVSWSVYRNTTDFYMLILYPATLWNLSISSDGFFL